MLAPPPLPRTVEASFRDLTAKKPQVRMSAIEDLARFPLAFQPGSRWHYSVGIDVIARVIEVIEVVHSAHEAANRALLLEFCKRIAADTIFGMEDVEGRRAMHAQTAFQGTDARIGVGDVRLGERE